MCLKTLVDLLIDDLVVVFFAIQYVRAYQDFDDCPLLYERVYGISH